MNEVSYCVEGVVVQFEDNCCIGVIAVEFPEKLFESEITFADKQAIAVLT